MARSSAPREESRSRQKKVVAKGTQAGDEAVPEKQKRRFEIDIFRGWCKSCGICSAFCPRECIGIDDEGAPIVTDAGRCTGCGWCELHCPDFAISVRQCNARTTASEEE